MPDITLCINDKCPMAEKCYRYNAEASDWQSVSLFKPKSETECDNFMEIWGSK